MVIQQCECPRNTIFAFNIQIIFEHCTSLMLPRVYIFPLVQPKEIISSGNLSKEEA